jgi:4-carboxymuconolactone decarboxylase
MARVRLLAPQDVPVEHRAFVEGLDAQAALIDLYRATAHSPVALRRLIDVLSCLWAGALSGRLREIAILSVVAASDASYPLGWHLLDAVEAGLTPSEIRAAISSDADAALPPGEAAVARFARELTLEARVSEATFQSVASFMDHRQIVELTMLAGLYRLVACVANGLNVDLEDEPARALERVRREP